MSVAFSGCWWRTLSRSQSMAETVAWRWSGLKQSPSSSIPLGPTPRWVRACPWSGFEKSVRSGCFNGSQSCDRSDILPQTIVINITPLRIHWLTQSWHSEQHFLQLETSRNLSSTTSIWFDGWRALSNVSHSGAPSIIISFYHYRDTRTTCPFQLRSSFITAVMHWSF